MVFRLCWRSLAIMARNAGALDCVVVNAHLLDTGCNVAVVTSIRGRYVVGWLTPGARPVVAGCASLTDVCVVKCEGHEVLCRVALAAFVARRRVRGGLAVCNSSVVATSAILRRTGKLIVDMAAFADDLGMCAGQWDAELAVIKPLDLHDALDGFLRTRGICGGKQHEERKSEKPEDCEMDCTPRKHPGGFTLTHE